MRFITAFLFSCLVLTLSAQEEKPIQVSGILSLEVFPGPPNYESIKGGDKPEKVWVLTVTGRKTERFQLVVADGSEQKFAALRQNVEKKILVHGLIWEAETGHHHTPFLISVRSIKEQPNQ